jgi:N-acyl-D-amino-acid deacylase
LNESPLEAALDATVPMRPDPRPTVVLRGGLIVDGTGGLPYPGDVEIVGEQLGRVGEVPLDVGQDFDVSGLVVSPGFIDIHTHFDAQVLWDADLTPSSWHGVTTVIMGNCGFGVAPTRPEHRERIARVLENVEGMSYEALTAGIPWTFETFPDYLDTLDTRATRLNVAVLIGHTPLRMWVMGDDSDLRAARPEETAEMAAALAAAMKAGAIGFASSRGTSHIGFDGRPVPSRLASADELLALADVVGQAGHGVIQLTIGEGLEPEDLSHLAVASGVPVIFAALVTGLAAPGSAVARADVQAALPGEVWAQTPCRPIVMQVLMSDPFPFGTLETFAEILALPGAERAARYRDSQWRDRARAEADATERIWRRWSKTLLAESTANSELIGRTIADLAAERSAHPLDTMLDIALEDDLTARFTLVLANDEEEELGQLLARPDVLLGLSDAGAHASQLCDACYSTYLLAHWVRETGKLSLETAVWRLTGHPADVFRIPGRGRLKPGLIADVVAFNADTVAPLATERVFDLPAGRDRLIVDSVGIEHMWVAGHQVRMDGKDLPDTLPGKLIRGGQPAPSN